MILVVAGLVLSFFSLFIISGLFYISATRSSARKSPGGASLQGDMSSPPSQRRRLDASSPLGGPGLDSSPITAGPMEADESLLTSPRGGS